MSSSHKIVFMGTPGFAVPALEALCDAGHRVLGVVTQPDRPKGRGRKIVSPAVKTAALSRSLEVIQPATIRSAEFARQLAALAPDLLVVVAFGRILPPAVLAVPRLGTVNIHASLLPKYRGPAPIQWAIINGERETGVTAMLMDPGLDNGDIIATLRCPIQVDDNAASLHDRLAVMGAQLLCTTLSAWTDATIATTPQDHTQATYAPLLTKKDGHIDWRWPAPRLEAFIRGMTPWPGAFTFFEQRRLKIFAARPSTLHSGVAPGTVIQGFADELRVATGQGALSLLAIQGAAGKRLAVKEFLRGCCIPPGTVLT